MNDIGKELYERVRADFEKRLESAAAPKDMRGVSDYSRLLGRSLAEAIAENVTENALPDGRLYYNIAESILAPALRTNYDLVNDTAAEVQRLIDERQGLRIKPARADYPEERVHSVIGAASEEGIPFDKALRRMTSPAENITASFADDFMKANAEQRSKAGFDTFIERSGGAKCCPWCAGLVGVYAYPKEVPKDVYCRHDNCTCSVTYGTKGGARQNVWTKAKWEVPPVQEPHRLTADEAAAKGAFDKPKRLTGGANGGIIYYRDSNDYSHPITEDSISKISPSNIFETKVGKRFDDARADILRYVMSRTDVILGTEFSRIYDENYKPIPNEGYVTGIHGKSPIHENQAPYHAIHNHGSDGCLSYVDLNNFVAKENMISLTAQGHLGSTYTIIATSESDKDSYFEYIDFMSRETIGEINGKTYTLDYIYNNPDFENDKKTLTEEQIELLKANTSVLMEQMLKGSEDHGFKYYISKVANP